MADELEKLLTHSVGRRLISVMCRSAYFPGNRFIDGDGCCPKRFEQLIKTFTIGFDDARLDESRAARIAQHLGTERVELPASADAPLNLVERMPDVYDEPFADVSQLPTLLLSELTRKHVTVALSGDGGDEFLYWLSPLSFGKQMAFETRCSGMCRSAGMVSGLLPPRAVNRLSLGRRLGGLAINCTVTRWIRMRRRESVYEAFVSRWRTAAQPCAEPAIGFFRQPSGFAQLSDPVERMSHADAVSYLPDDLLVKIDRATMAVSPEGRASIIGLRSSVLHGVCLD